VVRWSGIWKVTVIQRDGCRQAFGIGAQPSLAALNGESLAVAEIVV
jgi:hypothetical protein